MREVLEYALEREEEIKRIARHKKELSIKLGKEECLELAHSVSKNDRLDICLEELNERMDKLYYENRDGEIDYETYKERRLDIQDVYYEEEKKHKAARENLAEEMADVIIASLFWMQEIFDVKDKDIINQLKYKISRMTTRTEKDLLF